MKLRTLFLEKVKRQSCPKVLVLLAALLALALPQSGWAQFDFITNADNTLTITLYTGAGGNVDIPSTTNGYPVTVIGTNAFYDQTALTGVTIPDSVTSIGSHAFWSCYGMANLTIGNSVTNIGDAAFQSCFNLTSVTIPNSVINLGDGVFQNCYGLTDVVIGNSVVNIGISAFSACSQLTSIQIPDSVTNIGNFAFLGCSGLTNLTIGNSVTSIGYWAFRECSSLTNITIPNSVTSIGYEAFISCSSLHQIHFQGNAPSSGGAIFFGDSGTVYYLPGTLGWGTNYDGWPIGWPTAQWYLPQPQILGSGYGLDVRSNGFQFTISWATNTAVVVEASTNLQIWTPVITNTLVNGTYAFGDSTWTNYPQRFYHVRSP
jgi:hypothetical protein